MVFLQPSPAGGAEMPMNITMVLTTIDQNTKYTGTQAFVIQTTGQEIRIRKNMTQTNAGTTLPASHNLRSIIH